MSVIDHIYSTTFYSSLIHPYDTFIEKIEISQLFYLKPDCFNIQTEHLNIELDSTANGLSSFELQNAY